MGLSDFRRMILLIKTTGKPVEVGSFSHFLHGMMTLVAL